MKSLSRALFVFSIFILSASIALTGCGGGGGGSKGRLNAETVDQDEGEDPGAEKPVELNSIFQGALGVPISKASLGTIDPDPTGLNPCNDYDGDGIPNGEEISSNEYIADYPHIVTSIVAPITMEIRVDEEDSTKNHMENVTSDDLTNSLNNSMETNHYTSMNQKTTPVPVKTSTEDSGSHQQSAMVLDNSIWIGKKGDSNQWTQQRENSFQDTWSRARMSDTIVFQNVNYRDNLDKNSFELNESAVRNITKNYRMSGVADSTFTVGPNAGVITASLYIRNETVNIPVRISNILCTLMFKTPAGEFLPVQSFRLRNDDWSEYEQDIYGDDYFGPFAIEIKNLNTNQIKMALKNGYTPQINVVSYVMTKVDDSNYNPGPNNLKIIEETAKGRTATIKIIGRGMREIYRVPAFDVDETTHGISPGISLKKALFCIFRDRIGVGERWADSDLTVMDSNLKWKPGSPDKTEHTYSGNTTGNSWSMFETFVKEYTDEFNVVHRIESIKRIGDMEKYNPFDVKDNPTYNQNELLSREEFYRMKYWFIYHNGRYYKGDINDPIWAGERYEIICVDIGDFNTHFNSFPYTPLQTMSGFDLSTIWNSSTNMEAFSRAVYLGKVIKGDAVHLELDLKNTRMLFDPAVTEAGLGFGSTYQTFTTTDAYGPDQGYAWFNFNYTLDTGDDIPQGMPQKFKHKAYGSTNSIIVQIDESQFASEYNIIITGAGGYSKTIKVLKNAIDEAGGLFTVTRNTLDSQENPVGVIAGGVYTVNVTAKGFNYGVPVTVASSALSGDRTATVEDFPQNKPGALSFTATGQTNKISFQISDSADTEYYMIKYRGPYNYGYNNTPPNYPDYNTVIAHAGYNTIEINPSFGTNIALTGREADLFDPGVYEVTVYAVNGYGIQSGGEILENCTEAEGGPVYITVNYEKYKKEKELFPKLSSVLSDQRSVDLEVNFNDGSGWYALKLSNNHAGESQRTINCLSTNYMEYSKQKYHIYFKAPNGDEYCSYNVFSGGREEVDIYIRTVAKPEYRETFWMKPNSIPCSDATQASRYIYTNVDAKEDFPDSDVVQYWIQNSSTDITAFKNAVENRSFNNINNLTAVSPGDFGLVPDTDAGSTDYFFSPMISRDYTIKASIVEELPEKAPIGSFDPSFKAITGSNNSILVSGLNYPQIIDNYTIYYKEGAHLGRGIDASWGELNITGSDESIIPGLVQSSIFNSNYTLCTILRSDGVVSKPAYRLVDTGMFNTWTARTTTLNSNWTSICYGNGLFVAVSNNNGFWIMTSPDAVIWTNRATPAANMWMSVCYGNGLFVAVAMSGTGNRVMTSQDGINWTTQTTPADLEWRSVCYANGLFVAVACTGSNNRVMTSPDGINWTIQTTPSTGGVSICYGNGLFVTVTWSGSTTTPSIVMTSSDGINWTAHTAPPNNWHSVCYGNGLFVAVACTDSNNRVMTSRDGINWTSRKSAADYIWTSVCYGNGLFVAVAGNNRVMTSPDGIKWTLKASAADNVWRSVCYGNGLFVAVAGSGTGNRVMTTP